MNSAVKSDKAQSRKGAVAQSTVKRAKQEVRTRALQKRLAKPGHTLPPRPVWDEDDHALKLFRTSRYDRVKLVKSGLPAKYVKVLSQYMDMRIEKFYRATGLARPTVERKIRESKLLNQDESERVMGIARLVGQAQDLVLESGGSAEFDAGRWVGDWLEKPLPALDGRSPAELMDTVDGRALVSDLLAQQQSGAYG